MVRLLLGFLELGSCVDGAALACLLEIRGTNSEMPR